MEDNSKTKHMLITICAVIFLCMGVLVYAGRYHQFAFGAIALLPWIEETGHERGNDQHVPQESAVGRSVEVPIFVYHSVRPYEPQPEEIDHFDITPELLERQLQYLNDHGFTAISFDTLVDFFTTAKPLPPKSIILTFDDGWENQYTYAFPLLKKYNRKATFFIFTNAINYRHFLTWPEIEEMRRSGMEIGSHTKSHPFMNKLSREGLYKEMVESKEILENHLGIRITAFATPFGYSNDEIVSIIREAGYESGRTLSRGTHHTKDDLLKLKSISVSDNFDAFVTMLPVQ